MRAETSGRATAAVLLIFGGLLVGGALGFAAGVRQTRRAAAARTADGPDRSPAAVGAVLARDAALGALAGAAALAVPALGLLRGPRRPEAGPPADPPRPAS